MNKLAKGALANLLIHPRWPQRHVIVDDRTLACLHEAQSLLPENLRLIVTRGYQPEGVFLKHLRQLGAGLFRVIYGTRRAEIPEIFGHNGHATNGAHVDIGIEYKRRRLGTLPFGVFTPAWLLRRTELRYQLILKEIRTALTSAGFNIHPNPTEALQIHCDLQEE